MRKPITGEVYQHFNRNFYVIIDSPKDATTGKPVSVNGYAGEEIVWYQSMQTGEIWTRSLAEFLEPLKIEGQTIERPRFKLEQFMYCELSKRKDGLNCYRYCYQ